MAIKTVFRATVSAAGLKRVIAERKEAEARLRADIDTVRKFIIAEMDTREASELRECISAAAAFKAFARIVKALNLS